MCYDKPDYKTKAFNVGDKVFFNSYWKSKYFWQDGVNTEKIGRYVRSPKWENKRDVNQLWRRYVEDQAIQEAQMEVLYDLFKVPIPKRYYWRKTFDKKKKKSYSKRKSLL